MSAPSPSLCASCPSLREGGLETSTAVKIHRESVKVSLPCLSQAGRWGIPLPGADSHGSLTVAVSKRRLHVAQTPRSKGGFLHRRRV